ncbi:MAG: undecaprenyl-diphosphatase UppP [Patescibacteria group bacterium]
MTIFHGFILGLIEGLTEFLPISSTAHLILAADWLKIPGSDFLKTFEISIQLGAILAVAVLYWKRIFASRALIGKITAAFIPTALIGFAGYKIIKNYLMDNLYIIAGALLIGGLILIILEKYYSRREENKKTATEDGGANLKLSYRQAVIVGCCQGLAVVPGVSRSAATIIGGLGLGISRKDIVEFSFLLALPTMLAATGYDLYKSRGVLGVLTSQDLIVWLIGFVMSFITAIIGIRFFLKFIKKNNFVPFGWYRIIIALVVLAGLVF